MNPKLIDNPGLFLKTTRRAVEQQNNDIIRYGIRRILLEGGGDMEPSEQSYNGILVPNQWPPNLEQDGSGNPLPVPYLDSPPDKIPIDVGRQLFIDNYLIESTTLTRRFHQASKINHNPVLEPETESEMNSGECPVAATFNDGVFYDPNDRTFKMWYESGWFDTTGYAISDDGIRWTRPTLDVVSGTNIVLAPRPGYKRDGACAWLDLDATNPNERFKMFQYFRAYDRDNETWSGGEAYTSADGIHWNGPTPTGLLGDNTTFFYNPFRKKWVYSIRTFGMGVRTRSYREHNDFVEGWKWENDEPSIWAWSDHLDEMDPDIGEIPQLYDLNAVAYESVLLGLIAIFRGPNNAKAAETGRPKTNDLMVAFSRDGFHWDRTNREPFIPSTRIPDTWDKAYIHAAGGGCLVVGDKLYFYYGAWSGKSPSLRGDMVASHARSNAMYAGGATGLATLRRDGFASMEAGLGGGTLTTRELTFTGRYLFINADALGGEVRVEIIGGDGEPFQHFAAPECIPVSSDTTKQLVTWRDVDNLSSIAGSPVRLRFHITCGKLYSFWVSQHRDGASGGYVAAGGPGFEESRDL